MNVTELMTLLNNLSTDSNSFTAKERAMYLDYLNIANTEMYVEVAASNLNTIGDSVEVFVNADNKTFNSPSDSLVVRMMYAAGTPLEQVKLDVSGDVPSGKYLVWKNFIECNTVDIATRFTAKTNPATGLDEKYIKILYSPHLKKLVEDVQDPLTETDKPPYPAEFHHYLVYGALTLGLFSNKIFIEKGNVAFSKWNEGKEALRKYCEYSL